MNQINNQKLGFDFSIEGKEYDEYRESRRSGKKRSIKEIKISQAKAELLSTGIYSEIPAVIGGGKEATVLSARDKNTQKLVCAKVFRYFTGTIKKRLQGTHHIAADTMAHVAAKQEYNNLMELYEAGISVPKPLLLLDNILVMEFIADPPESDIPALLLREVELYDRGDPLNFFNEAIELLVGMFVNAHYVHGDYSDHNLMFSGDKLITMDVSQSMPFNYKTFTETPVRMSLEDALDIFKFDLNNLCRNFKKRYRIDVSPAEIVNDMLKLLPSKMQDYLRTRSQGVVMSNPRYDITIREAKRQYRQECARNRKKKQKRFR